MSEFECAVCGVDAGTGHKKHCRIGNDAARITALELECEGLREIIGRAIPAVKSKEQVETFHGSKSKADKFRALAQEMQAALSPTTKQGG